MSRPESLKRPTTKEDFIAVYAKATYGHCPDMRVWFDLSIILVDELLTLLRASNNASHKQPTFLDWGCGNGRLALGFVNRPDWRYIGLDILKQCTDFATSTFIAYPNISFLHVAAQNDMYAPTVRNTAVYKLPFNDASVTCVAASSLFTHLKTIDCCDAYVQEAHRVLVPGGLFLSSWFRTPPNPQPAEDAARTVLSEAAIVNLLGRKFDFVRTRGGFSADPNDQWCIYANKH